MVHHYIPCTLIDISCKFQVVLNHSMRYMRQNGDKSVLGVPISATRMRARKFWSNLGSSLYSPTSNSYIL